MDAQDDEVDEAFFPVPGVVLIPNAIEIFVDPSQLFAYLNKYHNKGA